MGLYHTLTFWRSVMSIGDTLDIVSLRCIEFTPVSDFKKVITNEKYICKFTFFQKNTRGPWTGKIRRDTSCQNNHFSWRAWARKITPTTALKDNVSRQPAYYNASRHRERQLCYSRRMSLFESETTDFVCGNEFHKKIRQLAPMESFPISPDRP